MCGFVCCCCYVCFTIVLFRAGCYTYLIFVMFACVFCVYACEFCDWLVYLRLVGLCWCFVLCCWCLLGWFAWVGLYCFV